MSAPATNKQLAYLAVLVEDREGFAPDIGETLTEQEAIKLIDHARTLPRVQRAPAPTGHYLYEGRVLRVRRSKTTNFLYAEALEIEGVALPTGRWRMARGMVNRVAERLNVKDAIRLGRDTGVCHVCGNRLVTNDGIHFGCAKELKT